jgi:hypothetical protein
MRRHEVRSALIQCAAIRGALMAAKQDRDGAALVAQLQRRLDAAAAALPRNLTRKDAAP